MEKKNIGKIVLIVGAVILTGGLIYFIKSRKTADLSAAEPGTSPAPERAQITTTPEGEKIITNFDAVWDYKISNNRWYTRKKGSGEVWLDMKEKLSAANYAAAVLKLMNFMTKK